MNASKPETSPSQAELAIKSLEEEIGNSVRGDRLTNRLTKFTKRSAVAGDSSETFGELVQKMGATSIGEIEKLISDLQVARNYLKAEADRIHQDIARYAHLSDTASASVKIITESLGQWRQGNEAMRAAVSDDSSSDAA